MEWQLTPVFLLGEFHGQRGLVSRSSWGSKELDVTEKLTLSLSTSLELLPNQDPVDQS